MNASDLEQKLSTFQHYYNQHRVHSSLDGNIPAEFPGATQNGDANLLNLKWLTYCRGLFALASGGLSCNSPGTAYETSEGSRETDWLTFPGGYRP